MTEKGESNVKVDARDQKKIQFQCSISYEVLCRRFLWSDVQSKIFYTVNPLLQFFFDINQWIRMICIQFQGNIIIFSFHHFSLSRPPSNQHQVEFVYFFFSYSLFRNEFNNCFIYMMFSYVLRLHSVIMSGEKCLTTAMIVQLKNNIEDETNIPIWKMLKLLHFRCK